MCDVKFVDRKSLFSGVFFEVHAYSTKVPTSILINSNFFRWWQFKDTRSVSPQEVTYLLASRWDFFISPGQATKQKGPK